MKKFYISLLLFIATSVAAFSQTPTISMATTISVGSQISFSIRGNSSSTPIQIDWGNGVKEEFTIGDSDEAFGFSTKGSTIKIWGQGIEGFNIQSNELTALELYEATSLKALFCKNNKLTTLDLSGCTSLTLVECKQNLISSLTLPNTTTLTYVDCSDNYLTLATLPIKQASWTDYIYSPQKDYTLPKTVYEVNEEIDLSSQLTINGNTTTYTWKTKGGTTLVSGTDFSANNGKFTFLKTNTDNVYCEMVNATFPTLTLSTTKLAIVPPLAISMTTTASIGSTFSFSIAATEDNTPIIIDWGNGILSNYTIETYTLNVWGTLTSSTIKIFGTGISILYLGSKQLTTLNVTNCISLSYLSCEDNQLSELDVSKNTILTKLYCWGNQLTSLDVSKNTSLTYLHCGNNQLSELDVSNNTSLTNLSCYSDNLSALDVSNNTTLTELDCTSNKLSTLDVTRNTLLTIIYTSDNLLTALDVSKNTALRILYCYSNFLNFNTLPIRQGTWNIYYYSPQHKLALQKKNYILSETIDLSSQLSVSGNTTSYIWKTKGGTTLTLGSDYSITDGITTFLKVQTDSVYCQMTNATFLGSGLVLSTTNVKITQYHTDVNEISLSAKLYPNPVKDLLSIESKENIAKVEIYSVTGMKLIEKVGNNTESMNVPTGNLPNGMLIVKVYCKNGIIEKKLIKE